MENYENFRSTISVRLYNVLGNREQLQNVLKVIDEAMEGYEMTRRQMDIIPADGSSDVVKQFLVSKAIANRSKQTLKQYKYKLQNFFATVCKSYSDITANDIRLYLYNFKVKHNASDRYMESIRVTINGFFQWLVCNRWITENPCYNVERIHFQEKKREALSTFSLESMRWNCKNVREKAIVDFLFSTGMRIGECAQVMLDDIDWEKKSVVIHHGKGDKERIVFFNDEAKVSLTEYVNSRTDDNPGLFVSTRSPHQQIKEHALLNIIAEIGKRIGLHTYPHKLRHTFATVGIRSGMPLEVLQALLGHSNPKTTLIYAAQDSNQIHMDHQKIFC